MTFKYSVTLPISGGNKLTRFKDWAEQHVPAVRYSLPPQTPIRGPGRHADARGASGTTTARNQHRSICSMLPKAAAARGPDPWETM
jgi:hypothetical protein